MDSPPRNSREIHPCKYNFFFATKLLVRIEEGEENNIESRRRVVAFLFFQCERNQVSLLFLCFSTVMMFNAVFVDLSWQFKNKMPDKFVKLFIFLSHYNRELMHSRTSREVKARYFCRAHRCIRKCKNQIRIFTVFLKANATEIDVNDRNTTKQQSHNTWIAQHFVFSSTNDCYTTFNDY